MMILPTCGAAVTAALGLLSLLFPGAIGRVLGIQAECALGVSELRATYGGFFLSLGIGCLIAQSMPVFTVAGAAWSAAALTRLSSVALDGSRSWQNLAGIVFEAGIGLTLLAARV